MVIYLWSWYYSALPISRGHFSPSNSWEKSIVHPLGRGMGVLRGFEVWLDFTFEGVLQDAISCYIVPRDIENLECCHWLGTKYLNHPDWRWPKWETHICVMVTHIYATMGKTKYVVDVRYQERYHDALAYPRNICQILVILTSDPYDLFTDILHGCHTSNIWHILYMAY